MDGRGVRVGERGGREKGVKKENSRVKCTCDAGESPSITRRRSLERRMEERRITNTHATSQIVPRFVCASG
jgi:hypothetical protein